MANANDTKAVVLNGSHIGQHLRAIVPDAEHVIVGEIRQVYHLGGSVTISYHALFGSKELLEVTVAHDAVVRVYDWVELTGLTIEELEA